MERKPNGQLVLDWRTEGLRISDVNLCLQYVSKRKAKQARELMDVVMAAEDPNYDWTSDKVLPVEFSRRQSRRFEGLVEFTLDHAHQILDDAKAIDDEERELSVHFGNTPPEGYLTRYSDQMTTSLAAVQALQHRITETSK